ncbi:MAG: NYN domain-containing protein [Rhodospirillales bacterium]|nr:NYN domain-containing protein [Rhodospirillales bacterium]
MERVISFVDGFNLYHAIKDLRRPDLKWVDLWELSNVFVGKRSQELIGVYYFSAYAKWLPGPYKRHREYVAALINVGVSPVMGQFKDKNRYCPSCDHRWNGHEEKETDVNIALALLNLAYKDEYDRAFVISRDSDLAPAIRMVRTNFPEKSVTVIAPPHRGHSAELIQAATNKAKISISHLTRCQLPTVLQDAGGNIVATRPAEYVLQT